MLASEKLTPTQRRRLALIERDGDRCHYCDHQNSTAAGRLTQDHVVPRARKGPDSLWNIVLACTPCQKAKADNWPTCACDRCESARQRYASEAKRPALTVHRKHKPRPDPAEVPLSIYVRRPSNPDRNKLYESVRRHGPWSTSPAVHALLRLNP